MFKKSQKIGELVKGFSQDRRLLLKRGGLFAGFTALASVISLTPFSPAHAAAIQPQSNFPTYIPLPKDKGEAYVNATMLSSNYQEFRQHVQATYPGMFTIQEQNTIVYNVKTTQTTFTQVIIPLVSSTSELASFYTATFRSNDYSITSEYNGLLTQKGAQTTHISIKESRGEITIDADLHTIDGSLVGNVQTPTKSVPLRNVSHNKQSLSSMHPADLRPSQGVSCVYH